MKRSRLMKYVAFVVMAYCVASWTPPAEARVEGYPYLDNELIGTFNVIRGAVEGPAEQFDGIHWNPDLLDSMASNGDAMGPLRYVIAFLSYGVAQTAMQTPAWRQPYGEVMTALILKMLHNRAWDDWIKQWGDNPLGPDNIMYTGHLIYMMTLNRQVFGDATFDSTVTLPNPDGPEFETDAESLAASVHAQASEGLDAAGEHTWSVACEPGRIYLPCNVPHRLAQITFDRIYGTHYADSNAQWLDWVHEHMEHPTEGVLYDMFYPFGPGESVAGSAPPQLNDRISGVYNGWSIWMLAGLDGAWSKELYPAYKQTFVVSGQASPEPDGRTMVLDRTGATGLSGDALNLVATGFGMVVARQFSDDALYAELEATWTLNFGAPEWTADGTQLRRTFPLIPLMIQNGFPLLARSTTDELNLATLSQLPWQPERFAQPFLESVAGGMVFVNQAFYDAQEDSLILTINGGEANAGAAVLTVAQLSPDETYTVRREAELYDEWRWDDDKLLITTPHLSPAEETYVVTLRRGVSDEDEGCASSPLSSRTGVGFALVLLAGVLFAMQRRHA